MRAGLLYFLITKSLSPNRTLSTVFPSVTINLFPFIFFRWDGSDITLVGGIMQMNMYASNCFYLHFTSFERCKDSANRKQNKMNLFIFYFEVPPIFTFEQR